MLFSYADGATVTQWQTVIMAVGTIASLSCSYNATAYLLEALLLSTCLTNCGNNPTKNGAIPACEDWTRPETTIPQGRLRGIYMGTHLGRRFSAFMGIPFAEPPVGDLRFKQAVPAGPWKGTLDAGHIRNECIQREYEMMGDEDCLYLNVYTPQLSSSQNATLLPVMVFIYGGQFRFGTRNPERWSPQFLLNKDVVLVVPSYRYGILGFLSTGDEVSPGNNLLKDIVEALRWTQRNIKYFGGDPNKVTIFGGSSGSVSVHLLTVSPLTKGLFHQYMTHSAPGSSPHAPEPYSAAARRATKLGEYLGCPTDTSITLVNCLRTFNASYLYDTEVILKEMKVAGYLAWAPVVEPKVEGALITDRPENIIANGKKHDLPWVTLVTEEEGIVMSAVYFNRPDLFQQFLYNVDSHLINIMRYDVWSADVDAQTAALKSRYLNDLTADRKLLILNVTRIITDGTFIYPIHKEVKQYVNNPAYKSPAYLCTFDYRGTFSYSYKFSGGNTENWGAAHGDELIYLLPGPKEMFAPPGSEFTETDLKVVDTMVELWTSFATNGLPTTAALNDNAIWEPFSSDEKYLQIGNDSDPGIQLKSGFHEERMQFWENFYAGRK
ncbi:carboxylic ester hydrolase-like isoform X1 [Neodiprion pinetum]|uniref:carboxylic ester hydrolase-like isoform X1 n=1 Tax=Neodiprion pinetum TaxID=441929 RepID=UPI001EE06776|nr:esterase E4-like isoform X1 [Neodiprion pinetum]XP_046474693.1 esterase E4-like isoform X2 [Neodiprion pinetum]